MKVSEELNKKFNLCFDAWMFPATIQLINETESFNFYTKLGGDYMADAIMLSDRKLKMVVDGRIGKVIWARKVFDDIYEVSFEFDSKGYQLWFVRVKEEGGFDPICCSMYQSIETMAIRMKEDMMKGAN